MPTFKEQVEELFRECKVLDKQDEESDLGAIDKSLKESIGQIVEEKISEVMRNAKKDS